MQEENQDNVLLDIGTTDMRAHDFVVMKDGNAEFILYFRCGTCDKGTSVCTCITPTREYWTRYDKVEYTRKSVEPSFRTTARHSAIQ